MAELLVRTIDKVNEDPDLDCHCTKRGDVIAIQPDGWRWGREEIDSLQYRVIKFPKVSVSEASFLLAPELPTDPTETSRLRRCSMALPLDHPAFHVDVSNLTIMDLMRLRIKKKPLETSESSRIF